MRLDAQPCRPHAPTLRGAEVSPTQQGMCAASKWEELVATTAKVGRQPTLLALSVTWDQGMNTNPQVRPGSEALRPPMTHWEHLHARRAGQRILSCGTSSANMGTWARRGDTLCVDY